MRNSVIGTVLASVLAMFAFSSSASASHGCAKPKVQCCKVVHHHVKHCKVHHKHHKHHKHHNHHHHMHHAK